MSIQIIPRRFLWPTRALLWALWQMILLYVALVVYLNLFSEYGVTPLHYYPVIDAVVALGFLVFALVGGTLVPVCWGHRPKAHLQ